MVCAGYLGCEAYDLILYICRTLTKLKLRVLIIDLSPSAALQKSVKHGMGLDSTREIINYRDINYTRRMPGKEELEAYTEGAVFLYYGSSYMDQKQPECDFMNIITGIFPHQIEEVNQMLRKLPARAVKLKVLIRDMITFEDTGRVIESLELPVSPERISSIYLDMNDYESAVDCQISQLVRFTRISKQTKKYITEQIHDMFPYLTGKRIMKAMALARRGV